MGVHASARSIQRQCYFYDAIEASKIVADSKHTAEFMFNAIDSWLTDLSIDAAVTPIDGGTTQNIRLAEGLKMSAIGEKIAVHVLQFACAAPLWRMCVCATPAQHRLQHTERFDHTRLGENSKGHQLMN